MVDTRTAASRRDYFRRYHALKKLGLSGDMPIPGSPRPKPQPRAIPGNRCDDSPVKFLRDRSGIRLWPERRRDFPETLEQTLDRVGDVDDD